jgi:RNase P/RNase MRP subunit POP5
MAKKQAVSKSQVIRDYMKAHPGVSNSEVAAELMKNGIHVTTNLVAAVRARSSMGPVARTAAGKVDAGAWEATRPAAATKKRAVRDYLKAHPRAKRSQVVEALKEQGIDVSPNYVSLVKAKRRRRRQVVATVVQQRDVGIAEIKAALACLKVCGSVRAAKEALAAADDIKKMVAAATAE